MSYFTTLSDLGFELYWLQDYAFFNVRFKGKDWGAIKIHGSALQSLAREAALVEAWYGQRKPIIWS